ncbi:MAG: SCO family protein [Thermoanaerobaculales bacterium]
MRRLLAVGGMVSVILGVAPGWARAQLVEQVPKALEEVGVTEHLDAKLPLDVEFVDESGKVVKLGDFFDGERPVILTLNYYRCPMLCGLMLNGVVDGLEQMEWTAGQEFELVTVSINPLETPALAAEKKQNYLKRYGRPSAATGWHFLTGREPEINRLAETVGFSYAYDPVRKEYAHAAVIFVCTPDGRVARYLYGIEYPPKRLKLALLEASEGKIGTTLDQLILYCYHYDPSNRRYSPVAMNIMRLGAGTAALVLALGLGLFWLREWRRRKRAERANTESSEMRNPAS